jgi:hypothetical protein
MAQADPNGPYKYKVLTESGVVTAAGVGGFVKAFGLTVTTNAGTAQLFDGTGSGTAGPELKLDGATANGSISSGDIGPVRFNTDIYLTLSGTGAEGWVVYSEDTT